MIRLVINEQFCKGCKLCVSVCRQGALYMRDDLNPLGFNPVAWDEKIPCKACLRCTDICPDAVIEIFED